MQRFYHSTGSVLAAFVKYKMTVVFVILFLFLFAYFVPLLKYVPATAGLVGGFLRSSVSSLSNREGRTNVLILGLGGSKNEPSGLTDTIIFASFDHNGGQHLLLSVPRDIWIEEMQAKLNTAYHYGNQVDGLGMDWAGRYVSEITGQPVHYVVVVSFDGFVQAVDLLGGVDVDVDRGFRDERYPIAGAEDDDCGGDKEYLCRYETISFEEGWQHMSGERALKFARSRNAEGAEGTDFARAKRQQKLMLALKDKILSPSFLLRSDKISRLIGFIDKSVERNIPKSHFSPFARLMLSVDREDIRTEVIGEEKGGVAGLLVNPSNREEFNGQWVLVPKENGWNQVHEWVECLLSGLECPVSQFSSIE